MTTCIFPGCTTVLSPKNAHGLCRTHNHTPDVCGCWKCRAKSARLQGKPEPEKKTVEIPYSSTNSGEAKRKPVTLRKAPWE